MLVKLFVLGRPGSGKSSAAKRIAKHIHSHGWSTRRFKDFSILYKMFQRDHEQKQFRPLEHGGFDVLDYSVLIVALQKLNTTLLTHISKVKTNKIIMIEFARKDYMDALRYFNSEVLQDAYFLLIEADLDQCIQRVRRRVTQPITPDNHFISEETLRKHYTTQYFPRPEEDEAKRKWRVIENRGSRRDFIKDIDLFVNDVLKKELVSLSLPSRGSM